MSEQRKVLDDAFLEAALEEVTREGVRRPAIGTTRPDAERPRSWSTIWLAAALLLGISAVVAVQVWSEPESQQATPAQDRVPDYGPIIEPRDADHLRELLSQVTAISMEVTNFGAEPIHRKLDPWVPAPRVPFTSPGDDIPSICKVLAHGIETARSLGPAIHGRNHIMLHVPGGRMLMACNLGLERSVHIQGFGAWIPHEEVGPWIAACSAASEERARQKLGMVGADDVESNASWLQQLGTVRATQGIEDRHLAKLATIPGLQHLDLSRSNVTLQGLEAVARIKGLRVLVLDEWLSDHLDRLPPATAAPEAAKAYTHEQAQRIARIVRRCRSLEVLSLRSRDTRAAMLYDDDDPLPLVEAWPRMQLLDLGGASIDKDEFSKLHKDLRPAQVSCPAPHIETDLRLMHPTYAPDGPYAGRQLRAAVEFAKARRFAIASVDVQRKRHTKMPTSDQREGTSCDVGPGTRILRQSREGYQWEIAVGQTITLMPPTDADRVILLHVDGANWIPHDDRTERLIKRFLR